MRGLVCLNKQGKNYNFFIIPLRISKGASLLPPSSKLSCSTSCTASSVASSVCSFHVSPLSLRRITISRSRPRSEAKCGTWTNQRSASSSGPITAHLDDDGAEELGAGGAELQHAGGDSLALHQGRRVDQLVLLQIPAHTTIVINDILQPSKRASKEKKDD